MDSTVRPFAIITGASSGIGYELARLCAENGFDLLIAADKPEIEKAAQGLRALGVGVVALQTDLSTREGVDTNITGTIYLVQRVGRDMRARNQGRIFLTGSIAGFLPGSFSAVYNGTEAFINSFSFALRNELKDTNVTVTCLMPGATETEFFERAGELDTKVGRQKKAEPGSGQKDAA